MSQELENFIDDMIREAGRLKYSPTAFIGMREKYGTQIAIERLVVQGEIQSGFKRLHAIGMLESTIEAAVIMFPDDFKNPEIRAAAAWRLAQARTGGKKRGKTG
jgi:hypothetical protein